MAELMILQSPAALLLGAAALFFCLFEKSTRAGRGWLSILSALLAIACVGVDLLRGADLREAAALLTVFLLLGLEDSSPNRFSRAGFRRYSVKRLENTKSIPCATFLVSTKPRSGKTALHLTENDFCVISAPRSADGLTPIKRQGAESAEKDLCEAAEGSNPLSQGVKE